MSGRRTGRLLSAALSMVTLAVAVAACGSSGTDIKPAARSTPISISSKDVEVAADYTGGKPGAATGSPIHIGLVSSNVGPVAQPYLGSAVKAAAEFVNQRLGGVDGHPIALTQCDYGATAQQGQACGNRFGNSKSIKAVLYTGGTVGAQQLHAANAGRKVYVCTITTPPDAAVANQFCTSSGSLGTGAVGTYLSKYLHVKKLAFISAGEPSQLALAQSQKSAFAELGITTTIGSAAENATDVTSAVLASGAQSADAVYMQLPRPSQCIPYIKALKTLAPSKPVISLATCMDPSVQAQTGAIPNYTFLNYGPITQAPDPTGQIDVYDHVTSAYKAKVGPGQGTFAAQAFGDLLLMTKIFNQLGANHLTTKAIAAKLASYRGGAFAGDPSLHFGRKPFTSAGSLRVLFFQHQGNDKWVAAANGQWLAPPE